MAVTKNKKPTESDYPAWWDWSEDGDQIEGTFLSMGRGFTAHGERTFVTLEVAGGERTVWLMWDALRNQFVREVQRRPDHTIKVGERVIARRLGERTSGNGRDYFDFRVDFPDGPEVSQADLLGVLSTPTVEPNGESTKDDEPAGNGSADDDIPF